MRNDPSDIWVHQDGADFYVHSDPDCNHLIRVETAPIRVALDFGKAVKAREWFKENGYFKGATKCHWPNPFK